MADWAKDVEPAPRIAPAGGIPPSIATALVQAQMAVDTITKGATGRTGNQSYPYVEHAELVGAGKAAALEAGLALAIPSWVQDGEEVYLCAWLVHKNGDAWEITPRPSMPAAERHGMPADKARGAALTYAQRYLWGQLLQIPQAREKGAERNAQDDGGYVPQERKPSAERKGKAAGAPATGTFRFGYQKGEPLAGAALKDLEWYGAAILKSIADPDKAKYRDSNIADHKEVLAAIAAAKGTAAPMPDRMRDAIAEGRTPEDPSAEWQDDDIPF